MRFPMTTQILARLLCLGLLVTTLPASAQVRRVNANGQYSVTEQKRRSVWSVVLFNGGVKANRTPMRPNTFTCLGPPFLQYFLLVVQPQAVDAFSIEHNRRVPLAKITSPHQLRR